MTDHKEFPAILDQIMAGKIELPNFKELPLESGVATIAAGAGLLAKPDVMNAKIPGSNSTWGHWARYFLDREQGGRLNGEGYVIWWDNSKGHVGEFAICEHSMVEGMGANHVRGWHPGHCSRCGLDMSVDSGD